VLLKWTIFSASCYSPAGAANTQKSPAEKLKCTSNARWYSIRSVRLIEFV